VQFNRKLSDNTTLRKEGKEKQASFSRILLPIFPRPNKSVLANSKFFKKNLTLDLNSKFNKSSYTQASRNNIKDIIKIKDIFSKLSVDKVNEINNIINKLSQKSKPRLNMIMKGPFKKQIIIPMDTNNMNRIMMSSNIYVSNMNRLLKDIKLEILINFIQVDNKGIIVTTNKVATTSDLNVIEKYMKGFS